MSSTDIPSSRLKVRVMPLPSPYGAQSRPVPLQLVSTLPLREQLRNLYRAYLCSVPYEQAASYAMHELHGLLDAFFEGVPRLSLRYAFSRLADGSPDFPSELTTIALRLPSYSWGSDQGGGKRVWSEMLLDGSDSWNDEDLRYVVVQVSMRRIAPTVEMLTELTLKLGEEAMHIRLEGLVRSLLARDIQEHERDN